MRTALTNCRLIDGTGAAPRERAIVVVEDQRIVDVRAGDEVPETTEAQRTIDLEGATLMPGMWEVHTHLGDLIPDPHNYLETETINDYCIRAGRNAMDALRAGITGIRTVGEDSFVDVAWKRAFERGVMTGPRLFVCTRGISITGGHGHGTLGALEVDGPLEMRRAVRENLKHGADQIKLMVTGGVMTEGESMEESQFLLDEIEAAVEVAHMKGKPVAVHAWGTGGVKTALCGCVDSIEHGLLDDEAVAMMVERDVFYVPTINCTQDEDFIETMPAFQIEKARGAAARHRESLRKAMAAGVKIACGSDTTPIEEFNKRELEFLVKVGMPEMDALVAATRTSAELCGVLEELGTVEAGKLADLVALGSDPLADISAVRDVRMVMKDGNLVNLEHQEGQPSFMELYS